ncbi:unnamed protein product [Anisakis simplex]|uniref:LisH domain-containing protein n=1 Tax=Anisakis simplex TaxID=6269 RepID=A0A0M3JXZ0_ANISI|nr:unnamed protein product [Anisakis simplex]
MTDVIGLVDALVKDYLSFRGLNNTLASFEAEVRHERDCKYNVSRVIAELFNAIENYDIDRLHSLWSYFNVKLFSNLSEDQRMMATQLENDLYRLYVIQCVQQKQPQKSVEFFERMCEHLRNNPEWNEWFALPYVNDAKDSAPFKKYFTKQWQHCFVVSLNNFLAIAFDSLEVPLLVRCVNDILKGTCELNDSELSRRRSQPVSISEEIMDDFAIIAQGPAKRNTSKSRSSLTACNLKYMINTGRTFASLPTTSRDESTELDPSKSEYLQPIDIEDLPRAQKRFAKQFEKVNEERVKEIFAKNYKNQIGMAVLLTTVIAIYVYTINAVKQETFLEEIDSEVAEELAQAEALKKQSE